MKFISKKDKSFLKIAVITLFVVWNLILSIGIIFLHQRINEIVKDSGEIDVSQMNLINNLNRRIEKLEKQ
ncbi:MAG: hypothetical protein Q4A23_00295 [bacterium]|nr:hypothetical protein [bacterium]